MGQTIHVMRHGEVENPNKILYGRQSGWHLSKRGQAMAEAAAEWSKQFNLGALHASPLERAQETASPIAAAHGLKIETDPRLIEAANIFDGKDALVVSHQLPIWILRSAVENRNLLHDPRKRICTLASVTSLHLDDEGAISGVSYNEPAKHLLPPK